MARHAAARRPLRSLYPQLLQRVNLAKTTRRLSQIILKRLISYVAVNSTEQKHTQWNLFLLQLRYCLKYIVII